MSIIKYFFCLIISLLASINFPELIRAIRRMEEVLQQVILVSKSIGETELEAKLEEAVSKIKRRIVSTASL